MPLDRSHRLADQAVVMDGPEDIALVLAALERLSARGSFTKERAQTDVAEEIGYQLITHPAWIRPHTERLVREHGDLGLTFDWQCVLMKDAPDTLIDHLLERHRHDLDDTTSRWLLMASRAPRAMEALAVSARRHEPTARDLRDLGFHLPTDGPVQPRFALEQRAIRFVPESEATSAAHAIGLPLEQVVAPGEAAITFHYLSVTPAALPGVPAWSGQAHVVSVRDFTGWTIWAAADPAGRLRLIQHEHDEDASLGDLNDLLDAASPQAAGAAEMLPFDDRLTYANQHVLMTPDVIGVAGGPPIGLAPAPDCIRCGRLMFHVANVGQSPREYGDGLRSLFICEDCRISATLATLWN